MTSAPQPQPVASQQKTESTKQDRWTAVLGLPCMLIAELPVANMTIADLLELEVGSLVESRHTEGTPIPVSVNSVMVALAEFEVISDHLGLRITDAR
jgi:flagellar motor switch protein FliN